MQVVLTNPRHHLHGVLITSGEKYHCNSIFMAPFQYQEADAAPSKGKVCIFSSFSRIWIRGLKEHFFFFGAICFSSAFGLPKIKLEWVQVCHRTRLHKKAANSFWIHLFSAFKIKRCISQKLVAWRGELNVWLCVAEVNLVKTCCK